MKCPHCNREIDGKHCPDCGASLPVESKFCMFCGASLPEADVNPSSDQEDPFDIESRVLCPDGSCTGIVVNGRCTECGKTYDEALASAREDGKES